MKVNAVVCAHNEEEYIKRCLDSIFLQTLVPDKVIVVLDRCVDGTAEIVYSYPVLSLLKNNGTWTNSYAENLQLARKYVDGDIYAIVDADTVLPPQYFQEVCRHFDEGTACISGIVSTDSPNFLGRLVRFKERFYDRFVRLERMPIRGCCLAINRRFLDDIGGFADVIAPDTYVLSKAKERNLRNKQIHLTVRHIRKVTLTKIIRNQILSGKARREQNVSPVRTVLHAIFRLRPFVMWGYLSNVTRKQE